MSGSNSGSDFEETSTKRLQLLLKDPAVRRDPPKYNAICAELRHRHARSKFRG
jgi:hypothetical protein